MSYLDNISYYLSNNQNLGFAGTTTGETCDFPSKSIVKLAHLVVDDAWKQRVINDFEHRIITRYIMHQKSKLTVENDINTLPTALLLVNFRSYLNCSYNCATIDDINVALFKLFEDGGIRLRVETVAVLKMFLMYCLERNLINNVEKFQVFLLDHNCKRKHDC